MSRPYDWSPLGQGSDPVPGDPEAVSAESRRLGQTAQELRTQIGMLQKIAGDTTLKGEYAGTMRAHAQQLSQDLDKVATRYENVADATGQWSGDLAQAQATSLAALAMAQGPYEQLMRLQAPQQPAAGATAAAQQQYAADQQYYQQAQASAQAAISDAQRLLGQATSDRDTAGATATAKISSASHDSLADSWWDQFKQMIASIAGNLKTIATVIGYVATICALLAVVLTAGPALLFLLLAGGLLLTELGIHTILAATGNGSWADVGFDIFALATLGYGATLDAGAETLEETARDAGVEAVENSQGFLDVAELLSRRVTELQDIAREFGDDDVMKAADDAQGIVNGLQKVGRSLGEEEISEVVEKIEQDGNPLKAVLGSGSTATGNAIDVVSGLAKRFPDVEEITKSLKIVKQLGLKNAITFMSGTTVDAVDKTLSLTAPSYDHLKDEATWALPADIGVPVVSVAELFGPTDFIVHITEFASK